MARPSVGDELAGGAKVLEAAGILNARREAIAIWASLAGVELGDVWLDRDQEAPEARSSLFHAAIGRRARGEPFPYVVGVTGFRKLALLVDSRVLIPRPETEGLVEHVLTWGNARTEPGDLTWGTAVDIGTGSGCIAISLAFEGRFDRVIATDDSVESLEVASDNLRVLEPDIPVELRLGRFLEPLQGTSVEVLVSNPPYLTTAEHALLDPGVRNYEPREALVSGEDGLVHTRAILIGAVELLVSGGLLAIEVDSSRAGQTLTLARAAGWTNARLEPDLFGSPRYLLATRELQ